MAAAAPPPYSTETTPSELAVPPGTPIQLATGDISGLRSQIIDNCTTLFTLHYGIVVPHPDKYSINTVRVPAAEGSINHGRMHAAVICHMHGSVGRRLDQGLFVQGPLADTTESALRGLLDQVERMLGRRWKVQKRMFIEH